MPGELKGERPAELDEHFFSGVQSPRLRMLVSTLSKNIGQPNCTGCGMNDESSYVVLIPSYNTGARLRETVSEAIHFWPRVWVIIDGSTDGSEQALTQFGNGSHLKVIKLQRNQGKGGAVIAGLKAAQKEGFRFALVMDADGQHPADRIREFIRISRDNLDAMVLGVPIFAADAPVTRRQGRRIGNWWANLETMWGGLGDSLFGFRIYPINESLRILESIAGARGYDFDTVLAVRLYWRNVRPINVGVPVRYYSRAAGGVSHFRYVRHNLLLLKAHALLVLGMTPRLLALWRMRKRI